MNNRFHRSFMLSFYSSTQGPSLTDNVLSAVLNTSSQATTVKGFCCLVIFIRVW